MHIKIKRIAYAYRLFCYTITSVSIIKIGLIVSVPLPSYNTYHDRHTTRTTAVIQCVWRSPHTQHYIKKREPLRCNSLSII